MIEHPDESLAEYVDGLQSPEERARVESHLATCAVCREEVELARRGAGALGALPEVSVPLGVAARAVRASRRGRSSPLVWRAAGLAAAAAAVIGGVVYLQRPETPERAGQAPAARPGGAAQEEAAEPQGGAGSDRLTAFAGYPIYEESDRDYDPESLTPTTLRFAQQAEGALAGGFPRTGREFYAAFDLLSLPAPAQDALDCVTEGVPQDRTVVPFIIQSARFRGAPAYLVVFLRGENDAAAYDRIQVLVVERGSCTVLHFARHTL